MRTTRFSFLALITLAAITTACSSVQAAGIEAVKGKQYQLTKRHGPWMIMVATFNKPPEGMRSEDGLTPEQAADELVYELRCKGIPAYTYKPREKEDEIVKTVSRRTHTERLGKVHTQTDGVCVLAGNYPSSKDPVGQRTLKYIKKFQPRVLQDVDVQPVAAEGGVIIRRLKNGGLYHTTADRPSPLGGAFMTTNPELSQVEIASRIHDELLDKLNKGTLFSLTENRGKYSVVVATFQGEKARTELANKVDPSKLAADSALGQAADRAWELCASLRHAKTLGYDQDYEAYIYHDHYSSIVTVGSFDTEDDPRIAEIQNTFGAKIAGSKADGTPALGAEIFAVPKKPVKNETVKSWIFDPYPRVIAVPK